MTKAILQSVTQKNVLYRKFIKIKDLTKGELLPQSSKIWKNTIQKFTRVNKSEYYKHLKQTLINKSNT